MKMKISKDNVPENIFGTMQDTCDPSPGSAPASADRMDRSGNRNLLRTRSMYGPIGRDLLPISDSVFLFTDHSASSASPRLRV